MGWQVEDLLREAMVLKKALDEAVSSSVLEKLLPKRYKQYQKGISQRSWAARCLKARAAEADKAQFDVG